MAGMQVCMIVNESSHVHGKAFFNTLLQGVVKEGGLVQSSVDDFHRYWNSYHVSASADTPGGVPDILFYSTESSLMPAAGDDWR